MPKEKTPIKAGSVSPPPSMATSSAFKAPSPAEDHDIKLDKIKITPFSDAKDWESTLFELKLILRQIWRDSKLDIISYITNDSYAHSVAGSKSQIKADQLIYYILSAGSVRDSFARNTIIAAQSKTCNIFMIHLSLTTSMPLASPLLKEIPFYAAEAQRNS